MGFMWYDNSSHNGNADQNMSCITSLLYTYFDHTSYTMGGADLYLIWAHVVTFQFAVSIPKISYILYIFNYINICVCLCILHGAS